MPLRAADVTSTKRFEDGDAWLELRTELSKGEADHIDDLTSTARLDPTRAETGVELTSRIAAANQELFRVLAKAWSLPGEPTGEAYASLDKESGDWVDECIGEVLRMRRERAEKKPASSARRKRQDAS